MFENNFNNEFVDTNSAVADTVNDFDDFYDDEPVENDGFSSTAGGFTPVSSFN